MDGMGWGAFQMQEGDPTKVWNMKEKGSFRKAEETYVRTDAKWMGLGKPLGARLPMALTVLLWV